jgi:hypothetical protein
MNERIKELAEQAEVYAVSENSSMLFDVWKKRYTEKFAELIVQECHNAVLSVPCYYKDYRSQIEESVIHDCANSIKQHFEIQQ